MLVFIFSIFGLILSSHLTLLWVFLELSTLSSTFLIIYQKSRNSLEAGWKYVFICSIGIALAFFGIILLTIGLGEHNSMFFSDLYKNALLINPFWLKLSFIFILIGMGTKMGLAPVHTWLPDAHSEAPSPISALLSGGLLNVAFLGIIRFHKIMKIAGFNDLSSSLLMLMGFFSIGVCALYVFRVKNFKRMFAYSSIENMGIIAIGTALGGLGLYAALLHMMAHSFSKASLFLSSGNLLHNYNTKSINDIHGLIKTDPFNAYLLLFAFLSLIGIPPCPIFISEFMMIKSMLIKSPALTILFVSLLTIVIAGMAKNIFKMLFGEKMITNRETHAHALSFIPQIMFLICLLISGIYLPSIMHKIITYAAFSI
jgi:hydrogenase-4 component F